MQGTQTGISFHAPDLGSHLASLDDDALDELAFGVIGFDASGVVSRYNRHEAAAAGLHASRVIGLRLFEQVAPCMNNFMVAQRFADARASGTALDVAIDYVLTLRMRPTPVVLRLLDDPRADTAYVLVQRTGAG